MQVIFMQINPHDQVFFHSSKHVYQSNVCQSNSCFPSNVYISKRAYANNVSQKINRFIQVMFAQANLK